MIKKHKIGDKVTAHLLKSTLEKVKITGTIKQIEVRFGRKNYIITGGVAEDFRVRKIT